MVTREQGHRGRGRGQGDGEGRGGGMEQRPREGSQQRRNEASIALHGAAARPTLPQPHRTRGLQRADTTERKGGQMQGGGVGGGGRKQRSPASVARRQRRQHGRGGPGTRPNHGVGLPARRRGACRSPPRLGRSPGRWAFAGGRGTPRVVGGGGLGMRGKREQGRLMIRRCHDGAVTDVPPPPQPGRPRRVAMTRWPESPPRSLAIIGCVSGHVSPFGRP